MLSPSVILAIQFTLGLIIITTVFRHHLLGHLQRSDAFAALAAYRRSA